MTTLATACIDSSAAPAAFFARWADMATWPEWNLDATFDHEVTSDGRGTHVAVRVTLDGPLAFVWRRVLGPGIRASLQPDLDRLGAAVHLAVG